MPSTAASEPLFYKNTNAMRTYYKFISADKIYIEDVFLHSHLYMTNYIGMQNPNDTSEGIYWLDNSISVLLREKVRTEKQKLMICCLTTKVRNAHMWQEFADSGNGICIAIRPQTTDTIGSFKAIYNNNRPYITQKQFHNLSPEKIAEEILKYKLSTFSDEKETRILKRVTDGETHDFLSVNIDRLYLGWNLSVNKEQDFREYASKANVKVIKLRKPIL